MKVSFAMIILAFSFYPFLSSGSPQLLDRQLNAQEDTLTAHTDSIACEYPVYVDYVIGFKCGIDSFTYILEPIDGNYIETTYLIKSEKGAMEIIQIEYEYIGMHSDLKMVHKSHSYFREGVSLKTCVSNLSKVNGSNQSYKKIEYYQPIPTGIWQSWDENGKLTEVRKD